MIKSDTHRPTHMPCIFFAHLRLNPRFRLFQKGHVIFELMSFLYGWSYKFLVGLNWKISLCSCHTSYSFCFFEQKWLSYEGFVQTGDQGNILRSFFHHFQKGNVIFELMSLLNGWSYKNEIGRKWKLFQRGFISYHNYPSYLTILVNKWTLTYLEALFSAKIVLYK